MFAHDLANMLAQAPAYLSIIDSKGRLKWCNRTGYGLHEDDLIGQPSDQLIPPAWRERWWSWVHRAQNCREVVRYRVPVTTPVGEVMLAGLLAPVIGADGRVRWLACVCLDATHVEPLPCAGCLQASEVPGQPPPVAASPTRPRHGLWLSPLEERVLAALAGGAWLPADRIAEVLTESSSGDLRAILRNLVERQLLESAPSRGYRLLPDQSAQ